jgi:ABC-2 type transport system permease protein
MGATPRAALVIAGKDLRQRLRDRSFFVQGILAPLGLALILSSVLGDDSFSPTVAVVDEDGGEVARAFDGMLTSLESDGVLQLTPVASADEARRLAEDDEVSAALVVPAGFSQAVAAGRPAEIQVIGSPDSPFGRQLARAVADSFAAELNAARLSVALVAPTGDPASQEDLARRAAESASPVIVAQAAAGSRELDSTTYFAAGMGVFFLFFTVQAGVLSLLAERRQGTLARLLAAPIPTAAIVLGKGLASFAAALLSMAVLVVASTVLLGADWGSPLGVATLAAAGVFAAMGITALVATLARTEEQAGGYSAIVAVVLGALGGSFFPLSQGPEILSRISLLSPHAWLMRGFGDLAGGSGATADVALAIAVLLAFGIVTGGIALLRPGLLGVAR